jgi:hypothetical protein
MDGSIPPPPDGYQLQTATASAVPPPPPGYSMQGDAASSTSPVSPSVSTPAQDPSALDQLGRATALTGRALAHGATSLIGAVNDPIVYGVNAAESGLGIDPKYRLGNTSQATDMALNAAGVPQVTPQNGSERYASALSQGLGGAVSGVGLGSALSGAVSPTVANIGTTLAANPGTQLAAATSGSTGSYLAKEAGLSPGAQMAIGIGAGMLPSGAGAAGTATARFLAGAIPATRQALAQQAADMGIDITAPQLSKSLPMKLADSTTSIIPFSGAAANAAKQQTQFNNAVGKTIGLPSSPQVTPDVFQASKQAVSQRFDNVLGNNTLSVDPGLVHDLNQIAETGVRETGITNAQPLRSAVDQVVNLSNGGTKPITGQEFQGLDSSLGRMAASDGPLAYHAGLLQDKLRDAIQSQMSPADASELADARGIWQNIKTLTPLVAKAQDGNIPPGQLMGVITASGAGKNAMATGNRGDLGTLAMIGQHFLKQSIPDSGTAARTLGVESLKGLGALGGIGAGVYTGALPGVAGTLLAARGIQSGLRSQALYNALMPQQAQAVPNILSANLGNIAQYQNPITATIPANNIGPK